MAKKDAKPLNQQVTDQPKLTKEAEARMKEIQALMEKFKDKVLGRFEGHVAGIALLPPGKTIEEVIEGDYDPNEKPDVSKVNALVLIDDTDSTKMSKVELKEKLHGHIAKIAKDIDKNIVAQTMIYSELWQYCFDAKTEVLQILSAAAPVYDNGMLAAIKIAEVHKVMVLKKFEKYIVSYVLAGSLVQGRATPKSDIDVFIIIDDTDVKKMTRTELKDKLRSIILGMAAQASEMTGINKQFNIQTYILTDFWDSIKEANPVIFTFLRDGVPFYDRGIFMPWKQLLKMGKVKPSMESIEMYMSTGEQMLERTKFKLKEIAMEDTYWSIIYPAQAAIMLYGLPPPTPRETAELMRKIFVEKEKMLEAEFVDILDNNIKVRKDLEHNAEQQIDGNAVDKCVQDAAKFLKRIKKLFSDIEEKHRGNSLIHTYDSVLTIMRDILKLEGVKHVTDDQLVKTFKHHVVDSGKLPQKQFRGINSLVKAKNDYESNNLHKSEISKAATSAQELIRNLVEYIQRSRGAELERMKIRVKHGEKFGEVLLLDRQAFIIHDIDAEQKQYSKAKLDDKGGLQEVTDSSIEELEQALVKIEIPNRAFIKDQIFVDLKKIFGNDVEVLINF